MSGYSLLFLILPLLIFVIVDSFASLNVALVAAIVAAAADCIFSYYMIGELDSFSVFSIFLVLVMAALSFSKKSRKIFYLKPAILSFALGVFLLVTYFRGQYVLYEGMTRYGSLMSNDFGEILSIEKYQQIFKNCSLTLGIASIVHGLISTWAAYKLTRWWWFVVAGLGAYVFLFLGMFAAMFM
jgi:intracellular septation protein A